MKTPVAMLMGTVLGAMLSLGAAHALRSHRASRGEAPACLTVNGEKVSMEELLSRLKGQGTAPILTTLLEERLIAQEAKKRGVAISAEQRKEIDRLAAEIKDVGQRDAFLRQMETAALTRGLLLREVKEEEKQAFFREFKDELVQYEVDGILLSTRLDGREAERRLKNGESFVDVVERHSIDPSKRNGGKLGFLTQMQIRKMLGKEALAKLLASKEGGVTEAFYARPGLMILRRGRTRDSYEQLKPAIENVLANARQLELMYELYNAAKIESPYLSQPAPSVKGLTSPETPAP